VIERIAGVLVFGNVVFDMPVWPAVDIEWNTTAWVDTIAECIGGNGANTSYTLAKLGVPAALMSLVGDDERGQRLTAILSNAGVDTTLVHKRAGVSTPCTVVLVESGGARKFYHRPGATREVEADSIVFGGNPACSHFHFGNPFAFHKARQALGSVMRRAKEAGLTTSIDAGWDSLGRWMDDLGPALSYTDLLFVNDAEEEMLGGPGALRAAGTSEVIVKTGANGCIVDGEVVPGYAVDAIDTTGAGDCFAGAFLAAIHQGWPRAECARFANAVGAMNVQHLGATTGVRSMKETLEWMRSQKSA
jgi:sugar/nucleoside kinase (ribokinase family)